MSVFFVLLVLWASTWFSLGFTGFYWVLLGFTGINWILLVFIGL